MTFTKITLVIIMKRHYVECRHGKCPGATMVKHLKPSLHYSDYRSKLVHFEAQKNNFCVQKSLA